MAEESRVDERGEQAPEWDAETARYYEHYWYNASKKLDLRRMDGFSEVAHLVRKKGSTYLHLDRLYTIWQAVHAVPAGAEASVEVGAFRGGSAKFAAETMRRCGQRAPFYVCDTFEGHVAVDPALDGHHEVGKQFRKTSFERVSAYLSEYEFVRVLKGDIRETAAAFASVAGFGYVHIDVDVHPITVFCLETFAPRAVPGAWIVVDDYGARTCPGVKTAVDDFARHHPEFSLLHLLTGQAILLRRS